MDLAMEPLYQNILHAVVLVLLPMIPAYFLFRVLPSTADISGPLKGLTLKLGGAFAGYFALFLALSLIFEAPSHIEVYTLRGRLRLGADTTANPQRWRGSVHMTVEPKSQDVDEDGVFYIKFPYNPRSRELSETRIYLDAGVCGSARVAVPGVRGRSGYGVRHHELEYDESTNEIFIVGPPVLLEPSLGEGARDSALVICAGRSP